MNDITVIAILGLIIFIVISVLNVLAIKWKREDEKFIEEYRNKFKRY